MKSLPETILEQSQQLPEGAVLSPKDFIHLGSRAAVDQAFSRLAKAGKLMRVARGTYATPVTSRFGTRPPAPEKVVRAMAEQRGETLVQHGARAANALGLTQQVPIKEAFLTAGRSRKMKLGKTEVLVQHAPRWMLALGSSLAGEAVRALAWLGQAHVSAAVGKLHSTLPESEWKSLLASRTILPSWMAQAIGRENAHA
ncbi:type IV toxin-antitoxin system AbiEi family antitoxin domain-containing protein [Pseudomonas sp. CrR25]|nr:type IV toxin-antitoxin system AbiEi family antitoxin domain-containing protein [Pseudomonas sp. CrR25]